MPNNVYDIEYDHWSNFPMEHWHWDNFSPQEIACRGTGKLMVNRQAMDRLQLLRNYMGSPLMLNSAYRSATHNKKVGGAKNSYHLRALAFDISLVGHNAAKLEYMAHKAGFTGFGYYRKNNFLHFDVGPSRSWGTKWFGDYNPNVDADFEVEAPRQPEKLTEDPIVRGIGVIASGGILSELSGFFGDLSQPTQLIAMSAIALGIGYILYKRL